MSEETQNLQHQADRAKPSGARPVTTYLIILFAAAFFLLLLSFFMQQRINQDAMNDLQQTSNSAVQTLGNLIDQRDQLAAENDSLQTQLLDLQASYDSLDTTYTESQQSNAAALCAMDWLREIQSLYQTQYYRAARTMIQEFEANGLPAYLPTAPLHTYEGNDAQAPADTYNAIVSALFPNGIA